GQRAGAAALEVDRMRGVMRDDLLTRTRVDAERDLVAHGPGGKENRRLLAQQLGHHLAELVDSGVLELLLVPHLRLAHEAAHVGGGPGDRVAVEVDVDADHAPLPQSFIAVSNTVFSLGTVMSSSTGEKGTGTSMAPMRLTGASRW